MDDLDELAAAARENRPVASRRLATKPARGRWLAALAAIAVLVGIGIAISQRAHIVVVYSPAMAGKPPDRAEAGFQVNHELQSDERLTYFHGYSVTNEIDAPLVIYSVKVNGEFDPVPSKPSRIGYLSSEIDRLPVTLSIGETERFATVQTWYQINYPKEVVYLDIRTNRGKYRFRPPNTLERVE